VLTKGCKWRRLCPN